MYTLLNLLDVRNCRLEIVCTQTIVPKEFNIVMSQLQHYTSHNYYCGLKIRVGREYRGPLYFMCRLKIRVA